MNTDTGKVYEGDALAAALRRGEPLVPISPKVARLMKLGAAEDERRKRKRKAQRKARKVNR